MHRAPTSRTDSCSLASQWVPTGRAFSELPGAMGGLRLSGSYHDSRCSSVQAMGWLVWQRLQALRWLALSGSVAVGEWIV